MFVTSAADELLYVSKRSGKISLIRRPAETSTSMGCFKRKSPSRVAGDIVEWALSKNGDISD